MSSMLGVAAARLDWAGVIFPAPLMRARTAWRAESVILSSILGVAAARAGLGVAGFFQQPPWVQEQPRYGGRKV